MKRNLVIINNGSLDHQGNAPCTFINGLAKSRKCEVFFSTSSFECQANRMRNNVPVQTFSFHLFFGILFHRHFQTILDDWGYISKQVANGSMIASANQLTWWQLASYATSRRLPCDLYVNLLPIFFIVLL